VDIFQEAVAIAKFHGHQIVTFVPIDSSSSYSNCTECGLGLVVDSAALLPQLRIEGDLLRESCVNSEFANTERMSRKRIQRYRPREFSCGYCGRIMESQSNGFCSDECYNRVRMHGSPSYTRKKVYDRDKGVCAVCGLDTQELVGWMSALFIKSPDSFERLVKCLVSNGFPENRVRQMSLWDCDHVIPVFQGGADLGMGNYQTLCLDCHRRKTSSTPSIFQPDP
jgi:5-methylcytosine-specific restriction enzyme A